MRSSKSNENIRKKKHADRGNSNSKYLTHLSNDSLNSIILHFFFLGGGGGTCLGVYKQLQKKRENWLILNCLNVYYVRFQKINLHTKRLLC